MHSQFDVLTLRSNEAAAQDFVTAAAGAQHAWYGHAPMAETVSRAFPWRAALVAGLVAGTLDISDAFVWSWLRAHVRPGIVLQYVASGLLGPGSFQMGATSQVAGLLVHFSIALSAAFFFALLCTRIRVFSDRPVLCGAVYGFIFLLFMRNVVLPLTLVSPKSIPMTPVNWANQIFAHVILIGIPIGLIVSRGMREKRVNAASGD